ncbi:hypothetical protein ACIQM4_22370 [Streptomyces sp. NPDC091272]|uniref:hypothetical protein n=1 Tax=Streptomyces sp. NPDC091272 TaxID=3365981 RepID=UPI0038163159
MPLRRAPYGNVGRGIAERAKGFGAVVAVTETDPLRAMDSPWRSSGCRYRCVGRRTPGRPP